MGQLVRTTSPRPDDEIVQEVPSSLGRAGYTLVLRRTSVLAVRS